MKKMKKIKNLIVLALAMVILVCSDVPANAATIQTIRTGNIATQTYTTNVSLTYSRDEFSKLKGKTASMVTNLNDGTKCKVTLKYYNNKVRVTAVQVVGHTNGWTVQCNSGKILEPTSWEGIIIPQRSKTDVYINKSGNVTLNFTFKM